MKKVFIFVFIIAIFIVGYFYYKNGLPISLNQNNGSSIRCVGTIGDISGISTLENSEIVLTANYDSNDTLINHTLTEYAQFKSSVHKSDYDNVLNKFNNICNQDGIKDCSVKDKNFKISLEATVDFKDMFGSFETITIPYEFIMYSTKKGLSCRPEGARADIINVTKVPLGDKTIGLKTKNLLITNIKQMIESAEEEYKKTNKYCYSYKNTSNIKFNFEQEGYFKLKLDKKGKVSSIAIYETNENVKVTGTSLEDLTFERDYDFNLKDYKC